MNLRSILISILPIIFLSACASLNSSYPAIDNDASQDILTGNWQDKAGMISSFSHGRFETRTPDTNEKLAEGNYIIADLASINIEVKSLVKGNISKVNCSLGRANNTLYCSPAENTPEAAAFNLFRAN